MKILIDESLPRYLKTVLGEEDVKTVQDLGWNGIKNGLLLTLAERDFDLFLTADKRLRYQQRLAGRKLAIIVFPSNRLVIVRALEEKLRATINEIKAGDYIELS